MRLLLRLFLALLLCSGIAFAGFYGPGSFGDGFYKAPTVDAPPAVSSGNLLVNIDASKANSVTLNGSNVSYISDQSGNGRDFQQATAGNQPEYVTASQNGLNIIRFTAANSGRLEGVTAAKGILRNRSAYSVYMVLKPRSTTASQIPLWFSSSTSATSSIFRYLYTATSQQNTVRRLTGDAGSSLAGGTYNTTDASVFASTITYGGSSSFYKNGTLLQNVATFLTSGSTLDADALVVDIGSAGTTNYSDVDFCQLLVYDAAHGTTDRQAIESYLKAKWGTP